MMPTPSTSDAPENARPCALSIGDAASETGLTVSALRYYEKAGLLTVPRNTSGQRRYDRAHLDAAAHSGVLVDDSAQLMP